MAAKDQSLGPVKQEGLGEPQEPASSPSSGDGERGASATTSSVMTTPGCHVRDHAQRDDDTGVEDSAAAPPMAKKSKLNHIDALVNCSGGDRPRLPSPTDVRHPDGSKRWGSQSKNNQATPQATSCQIKTLPPTLRGIADSARVLHASRSSLGEGGKENRTGGAAQTSAQGEQKGASTPPLLLSFPTESVYMLACCVKTASPRSIRKLLSRNGSQTSMSTSSSAEVASSLDSPEVHHQDTTEGNVVHMGNLPIKPCAVHATNPSLEWIIKCNDHSTASASPTLFVLDELHALTYCHFTNPKTFAIRPPTPGAHMAPTTPNKPATPRAPPVYSPLPIFGSTPQKMKTDSMAAPTLNDPTQAPLTPKPVASATGVLAATPITTPTTCNQKLHAANFSESREAFLRLASKFWPGPMVIHVRARMLGEENMKPMTSSRSSDSLPSLPSMSDIPLAAQAPSAGDTPCVPVLPPSVLTPSRDGERAFVGMRCPSHPLSKKILNEIYRGSGLADNQRNLASVEQNSSFDSLASITSGEGNANRESRVTQRKVGRGRTGIAVVGCIVPGSKSDIGPKPNVSASMRGSGVTTAENVDKVMSSALNNPDNGRIFIVDGEDTRESFSVPTCQHDEPHPISLVVDGENRTVHLIRNCQRTSHEKTSDAESPANEASLVTKSSVYRALLETTSHNSRRQSFKGDGVSVDRVITAVLSRWKIEDGPGPF